MTKICVVCEKEPIPRDKSRSFHKFPKDDARKRKWMLAIGKNPIYDNSYLCSDHFTNDSYHQTGGYATIRRLLPNAVPIKIEKSTSSDVTDTVDTSTNENYIKNEPEHKVSGVLIDITNINDINDQQERDNIRFNNQSRNYPLASKASTKKFWYTCEGGEMGYLGREHSASDAAWERFVGLMEYLSNQSIRRFTYSECTVFI
ncbi:unnamed protein product, partial [Brenthis ino]